MKNFLEKICELKENRLLSSREYDILFKQVGSLAQPGEHLPYKQRVIGSIPITSTINSADSFLCGNSSVVERHLAKVNVAGSSLVSRSNRKLTHYFFGAIAKR